MSSRISRGKRDKFSKGLIIFVVLGAFFMMVMMSSTIIRLLECNMVSIFYEKNPKKFGSIGVAGTLRLRANGHYVSLATVDGGVASSSHQIFYIGSWS